MQHLHMVLCNTLDVFQKSLFSDIITFKAYIENLLVLINGTLEDHLEQVGKDRT